MINGYYLRNRFVVVYNKAIIIIINKILRYLLAVVKHYLQTFEAKSKLHLGFTFTFSFKRKVILLRLPIFLMGLSAQLYD